jgi:peptide/nickel transport system substrate-binding protein
MRVGLSKKEMRQGKQQVEAMATQAESLAERHFFRRLDRLVPVRRFIIGWILLFVLLCGCMVGQIRALDGHFLKLAPIPGGIYSEGVLGDFTTASPLYASGEVDETVSKLLFASLFKYDDQNKLIGDLASGYSLDPTERIYTVNLRPHLVWHDGAPLTAKDILFTYQMIQNPDAGSYLYQSWKDVKVAVVNDSTLTFTLPNQLSSFPHHMTNGIVPEHLLKSVIPSDMRSVTFNTLSPVGAGPFMWQKIEVSGDTPETRESQIALLPFQYYHNGAPKLASFVVHAYHNEGRLEDSFKKREVTGASFLTPPDDTKPGSGVETNNFLLTAADMVFFKMNGNPVLADVNVRKALVLGADIPSILQNLGYPTHPVQGPFLQGQIGYDKSLVQPTYNQQAAAAALDSAGWKVGANGVRAKGTLPLTFALQAQDTPENRMVTAKLQDSWRAVGARVTIQLKSSEDMQMVTRNQDYDALLYGISIGADPDVYVYWDSTQRDPRSTHLNFSQYASKVADTSLEGGRTRSDAALRTVKYRPFLQAWQTDSPALGLYQPRYLYLTHGTVYNLQPRTINSDTDRFNNVNAWEVREASTVVH